MGLIGAARCFLDVIDPNDGIVGVSLCEALEIQIGLVWKKRSHLPNHALRFIHFMQRHQFKN